jgi:hypothetical protein
MRISVSLLRWTTHVTRAFASAIEAVRLAVADAVEVPICERDVAAGRRLRRDLP